MGIKKLMSNLHRLVNTKGFTFLEVILASVIISIVAVGIWEVYWSVVNTYYVEQRGVNLEAEGERILDLIANGGYCEGKRIYGLNSGVSVYSNVGEKTSINFQTSDYNKDAEMCTAPATSENRDDYRIEFILDNVSGNTRYAEFAAQLYECDPDGTPPNTDAIKYATGILWFRLKTDGTGGDPDYNYEVAITDKLLSRTTSEEFKDYEYTWFKAKLLSKDPSSNYYSGIKISFYLVDYPTEYDSAIAEGMYHTIKYNKNLERDVDPPISDPDQRRSFMGGIPYPQYFSTTIYFPNRE